ncbi:Xenotropic and polytropic retrovirus receptor 1, partial [Coemansia spiralis]
MKFGKYLEAEQVPEWAKMYVDYVGLKRAVAAIVEAIASQRQMASYERMPLPRRTSASQGYDSFTTPDAPTRRSLTMPRFGSGLCSDAGCNHFGSIVSASPQIALRMSAANSGKLAATPDELTHNANIKIPLSARDTFTEATWTRRPFVVNDHISAGKCASLSLATPVWAPLTL